MDKDIPEYCRIDCKEYERAEDCPIVQRNDYFKCKKKPVARSREQKKIDKETIKRGMTL